MVFLLVLGLFVSSLSQPHNNESYLDFALYFFDLVKAAEPNMTLIRPLEGSALAQALPTSKAWRDVMSPFRTFVGVESSTSKEFQAGFWLVSLTVDWTYTMPATSRSPEVVTDFKALFYVLINILDPEALIVEQFKSDFIWTPPPYVDQALFVERPLVGIGPCNLTGTLTLPVSSDPSAAVLLIGGSGGGDQDETYLGDKVFKDLAWGIASAPNTNVAVLRFEKRTHAVRPLCPYTPDFTYENEYFQDTAACIEILKNTFPGLPLYVLGHSLGGRVVWRIASRANGGKDGLVVHGAISLAGSAEFQIPILQRQYPYIWTEFNKTLSPAHKLELEQMQEVESALKKGPLPADYPMPSILRSLPVAYVNYDMYSYDPILVANHEDPSMKLLFLNGERDYQVTIKDDFDVWKAGVKNPKAEFESFEGLTHFMYQAWPNGRPSYGDEYVTPGHVRIDVLERIVKFVTD